MRRIHFKIQYYSIHTLLFQSRSLDIRGFSHDTSIIAKERMWLLSGKATSHIQLKHPTKPGKVTVANHPGDIPPFTLKSIWKQAGIKS